MHKRKCFCGKTEKNFKIDIGPAFYNECCKDAGYDIHGKRAEDAEAPQEPEIVEEAIEEAADLNKDGKVDEEDLSLIHKVFSKKKAKKKTKKKTKKED